MFYRELHPPYLNCAINPNCHETTLFAVPAAQSDEYRCLCPTRDIAHRPAIVGNYHTQRISRHFTMALNGAYNAWKFGNDMKLNHYLIQPELRYWPCRKFEGHFPGVHGHYAYYNVGQIPFFSGMEDIIYRGDLYGGGITYGYHWVLGDRFSIEAVIGGGYARMEYDKYRCAGCGERMGHYKRNYFGPTRAGVSLIYFIR